MLVDPGVYMVDFYGFYVGKYTIVPLDRDYIFGKGSQTYPPTKKKPNEWRLGKFKLFEDVSPKMKLGDFPAFSSC